MRLEQLQYLIALQDNHSMGITAESHHISQQAVSSAIRQLESELGIPLVVRNHRGSYLTKAGKEFSQCANSFFEAWNQLLEQYRSNNTESEEVPVFLSPQYAINPRIAEFISVFSNVVPQSVIAMHYAPQKQILEQVMTQQNAIGISMLDRKKLRSLKNCYSVLFEEYRVALLFGPTSEFNQTPPESIHTIHHKNIVCFSDGIESENPLLPIIQKYDLFRDNHILYNAPTVSLAEYLRDSRNVIICLLSEYGRNTLNDLDATVFYPDLSEKVYGTIITTSELYYSVLKNSFSLK